MIQLREDCDLWDRTLNKEIYNFNETGFETGLILVVNVIIDAHNMWKANLI